MIAVMDITLCPNYHQAEKYNLFFYVIIYIYLKSIFPNLNLLSDLFFCVQQVLNEGRNLWVC